MFIILIKLLFILIVILTIISLININKYNKNSVLVNLEDFNSITKNRRILDPILFNSVENLEISEKDIKKNSQNYYENDGKLIRLSDIYDNNNIDTNIYDNYKLIKDFNLDIFCNKIYNIFSNYFSCNKNYSGYLLNNIYDDKVNKNNNNLLLIYNVFGNLKVYIVNPKHKDDIKDKEVKNIKKWSIEINLKKDNLLYIPANWYYFIEIESLSFLLKIKSDSLFTYIYNKYK